MGAAIDQSVERTFATIEKRAQKAQVSVQRQQRQSASNAEKEAAREVKAKEKAAKALELAAARTAKAQEREAARANRTMEALDRQRSRGLFQEYNRQERAAKQSQDKIRRELEKTARAAERALDRERRARERTARRAGESFARRTSDRTTRFLMPNAPLGSMAMRGLSSVASGAGIDLSLGGGVGRNIDLQSRAIDLSNSGYQAPVEGQPVGANNKRVDPKELIAQARQVGGDLGIDPSQALEALAQFQKIAGDLDAGRQSLAGLAKLASATGTDLGEMAAAAANVSNGLGDIPDKAKVTEEVMRTIAGQGKLGAVEISDMAVQMARVAAAAGNFAGDKALNIQKMGALVQLARAEGGAPSAAEAARSVGGFSNTFLKDKRSKAFEAATGKSAFSDESHTKLKDPITLIKEALTATKGDLGQMNKIFQDVVGARTVSGLQKKFVGAGGGEAGLKEVDAAVQKLLDAQLKQKEIDDSAAVKKASDAAAAIRFQNELDQATQRLMAKLVPALEQAAPAILKFADVIGKVATWAIDNPKSAIAGAITASIARAGIESSLRSGIERIMLGKDGANAGKLGAAAGTAGSVLTIAAIAVTTFQVGKMFIDEFFANQNKERDANMIGGINAVNSATAAAANAEGKTETPEELKARRAKTVAALDAQKKVTGDLEDRNGIGRALGDLLLMPVNEHGKGGLIDTRDRREAQDLAQSKLDTKRLEGLLASIDASLKGGIDVNSLPAEIPGRAPQ